MKIKNIVKNAAIVGGVAVGTYLFYKAGLKLIDKYLDFKIDLSSPLSMTDDKLEFFKSAKDYKKITNKS
ncbi:MAG: hypothetical protein QXV83_01540 [Candidatus Anstonellaceae archaeon]